MSNQNLARLLRALTWLGAALLLLMPTLTWLTRVEAWPGLRGAIPEGGAGDLVVLALLSPPFVLVAWGLVQLSGFCSKLERGDHFSRAAANALQRFGWALVAAAALLPFSRIAVRAYAMGGGWDAVALGFFRTMPVLATAMGLILGLIVIVFAAILEQATALAEENARFV